MWVEEGTAISWDEFSFRCILSAQLGDHFLSSLRLGSKKVEQGGTMAQCEAILTDGPVSEWREENVGSKFISEELDYYCRKLSQSINRI